MYTKKLLIGFGVISLSLATFVYAQDSSIVKFTRNYYRGTYIGPDVRTKTAVVAKTASPVPTTQNLSIISPVIIAPTSVQIKTQAVPTAIMIAPASVPASTTLAPQVPLSNTVVTTPIPSAPASKGTVLYSCDFEAGFQNCGFTEQSKMENEVNSTRVTTVSISRTGSKGIQLTTEPGDSSVHGSGDWERADLRLSNEQSDGTQGKEAWWSESVYFPTNYVLSYGTIMDFHNSSEGGNANFHLMTTQTGLRLIGFGGDQQNPKEYKVELGQPQKNVWYDFVYHVKWSEGDDGFMEAWMNGKKVLSYKGPTLYKGQFVYLKLANYHEANGQPSSIIQDRIIRGTTAESVALTALDGVQ